MFLINENCMLVFLYIQDKQIQIRLINKGRMNKEMLRKFLEEVIKSFRYGGSYIIILIMYIICKREKERTGAELEEGPESRNTEFLGEKDLV